MPHQGVGSERRWPVLYQNRGSSSISKTRLSICPNVDLPQRGHTNPTQRDAMPRQRMESENRRCLRWGKVDGARPGLQFFQPRGGGVFVARQRGGGMEDVGKVG
jgi:hypothetical protein